MVFLIEVFGRRIGYIGDIKLIFKGSLY